MKFVKLETLNTGHFPMPHASPTPGEKLQTVTCAMSDDALRALHQRIADSGVLGRSLYYQKLLAYLVDCAISGATPRELDLAIDALGKGEDFDVASDSTVRVYVHQLRKKLDAYYEQFEPDARQRLCIPRGQYRLALVTEPDASPASTLSRSPARFGWNTVLLLLVAVLLLANLVRMGGADSSPEQDRILAAVNHPVWQSVLADNKPVLLVMGDYYIFGELNANGNVARMVREFDVNSSTDLENLRFSDFTRAENYLDLDLSYMPEGSAFALARIVPILESSGKTVNITMMSDLTMADLRSNHIVYIGYISALDKLSELTFMGSELRIGRSFDELYDVKTLEYYTSDAGLPEAGQHFRDYGLFATYPVSADTQVILISGMRDAGVMHTAQALSDPGALDELSAAIGDKDSVTSFEALFEVYGVDRMNFDAALVHAAALDKEAIWRARPAGNWQAATPR